MFRQFIECRYLPDTRATIHINAIEPTARRLVETYRKGKHIAYHRSMDMKVKVNTDTVTDTVCKGNHSNRILFFCVWFMARIKMI